MRKTVVVMLLFAAAAGSAAYAETARFATLNVYWLYDDAPPHKGWAERRADQNWEEAVGLVASAVAEIDADVIALQEVEGLHAVETLNAALSTLGKAYPYFWVGAGTDPFTGQDVAILSRYAALSEPIRSYPSMREEFYNSTGYSRLATVQKLMRVDLEISGEPVTVYALHLKSKRGKQLESDAERFAQARIVRRLVRTTLEKGRPNVVVMGDFNDVPGSAPLRRIRGLHDSSWKLLNAARSSEMKGEPWTFIHEGTKEQIDHVLLSKFVFERIALATVVRFEDDVTDHDAFVVDVDFGKKVD